MKLNSLFGVAILAGLIYVLVKRAGSHIANSIWFEKATASFTSIDLTGADIQLVLTYRNDSDIPIPIDSFNGVLMYGPAVLSNIRVSGPISIAAKTTTQIPVKARIAFVDLATDIIDLIKSKQFLQELSVTGIIDVKGVLLDVEYPITLV